MYYNKGDLVLVSNGERTTTCIILTTSYTTETEKNYDFYYSYCLEDGLYGLVYGREIVSVVATNFAPDFEFESELFDTNYTYYADLYERFAYFPTLFPSPDGDSESSDDE